MNNRCLYGKLQFRLGPCSPIIESQVSHDHHDHSTPSSLALTIINNDHLNDQDDHNYHYTIIDINILYY